jgi:hypothetical protein
VVNLILKSDYQGADIFNYYGISQRGDDETYHGYFVSGLTEKFSDTSKLSVVTAVDYYASSPIMQDDRADTQLNHSLYSYKYPSIRVTPMYHAGRGKWLYFYLREWHYRSSNVCFMSGLE